MKQKLIIATIFLLTTLLAYGQKKQSGKPDSNQELISSLRNKIDQQWIRENPSFAPTTTSFFNGENENKYFVGLLQMSGIGVPFTWDDNVSLLQFLLACDNKIDIKQGSDADPIYKGTKIGWNNDIHGLIWFNGKSYKAAVDNWHLIDFTECPGTITFPNLSFNKVTAIPNAVVNDIKGLTILPYTDNLKIKSTETTLTTDNGLRITGIAYDLNDDRIFDIFTCTEEIDETTSYHRLYINVSGHWKCSWINLDQVCI